jgi:uncharacterized protein with ParB-like and HNH nuclease domain
MPLDHFVKWVNENVEDCGLELNPDFQRGHVWTEKQQIAYIEFLLRRGKSGRVIYFNCPYWSHGSRDGWFVCVDGLQRTTAIMRFINNEIPAFGCYYKDFEDKPSFIRDSISVNINNLQSKAEVLQWYLEMNTGGTPHSDDELEKVKYLLQQENQ